MTNLQITVLQIVLFINENRKANSREIAEYAGVCVTYVENILLKLKKAGIVRATRGPGGGYFIARELSEIKVTEVLFLYQKSISNIEGLFLYKIINEHLSGLTMEELRKSLIVDSN